MDNPPTTPDDEALSAIQTALGIAARRAKDLSLQEAVGARAGYEIEGPLYSTLSRLGLTDRYTVSELAERCGMELSTVSRRVRILEERGLVERETPDHDRRSSYLRLSPEGRVQFEVLSTTWRQMLGEAMGNWEPDEITEFARMFDRFARDLETYALTTLLLKPLAAIPLRPTDVDPGATSA